MAIKHGIRHFIDEIHGRRLTVYTDHKPLLGSWANPNLQAHDAVAMNALNEIAQWTNDIRYRPGKELLVPDLLSRPFRQLGNNHLLQPSPALEDQEEVEPEYVSPQVTLAALEEVSLNVVSPSKISEEQKTCQDVKNHKEGLMPKGIKMETVNISGYPIYCEVSDPANPRPLLPKQHRSLVINLLHHQDHPS